jgi:hypothetical protein
VDNQFVYILEANLLYLPNKRNRYLLENSSLKMAIGGNYFPFCHGI